MAHILPQSSLQSSEIVGSVFLGIVLLCRSAWIDISKPYPYVCSEFGNPLRAVIDAIKLTFCRYATLPITGKLWLVKKTVHWTIDDNPDKTPHASDDKLSQYQPQKKRNQFTVCPPASMLQKQPFYAGTNED